LKLDQASILGRNDFPGENENFYSLLTYVQQFFTQVRDLASKKVTFDDNIDNQLLNYEFTDMVTVAFKNNLNRKPTEIVACTAQGQMVVGHQLEYLQSGQVNITVKFLTAGAKALCKVRIA
jgi:hypothetical protein